MVTMTLYHSTRKIIVTQAQETVCDIYFTLSNEECSLVG